MTPLLLAISFLRVDITTGTVTGRQWPDEIIADAGSLWKPFIALAYAQRHEFRYPQVTCRRCWLPRGHGRIEIEAAISNSCNTYFDELRRHLQSGDLDDTLRRFGVPGASTATPEQLLRAFVELAKRRQEPGVLPLLEGMRLSAQSGTAKELKGHALAKTGTAACTHLPKAPGDGFVVVLTPDLQPRTALLLRLHGRPGSLAAKEAARLLK
ncbi:MAG: hypothetical protein HYZ37_00100 [Candidatus Solibacter usitatus]|nr:hypothetical protein [Candidatus Solibacter usitatus]